LKSLIAVGVCKQDKTRLLPNRKASAALEELLNYVAPRRHSPDTCCESQKDLTQALTIPPTRLVVRSYVAYKARTQRAFEFHQRSWWFVHIQPNVLLDDQSQVGYELSTNCVGGIRGSAPSVPSRLSMNSPPPALVGLRLNTLV
jgi:hypothetical protein